MRNSFCRVLSRRRIGFDLDFIRIVCVLGLSIDCIGVRGKVRRIVVEISMVGGSGVGEGVRSYRSLGLF